MDKQEDRPQLYGFETSSNDERVEACARAGWDAVRAWDILIGQGRVSFDELDRDQRPFVLSLARDVLAKRVPREDKGEWEHVHLSNRTGFAIFQTTVERFAVMCLAHAGPPRPDDLPWTAESITWTLRRIALLIREEKSPKKMGAVGAEFFNDQFLVRLDHAHGQIAVETALRMYVNERLRWWSKRFVDGGSTVEKIADTVTLTLKIAPAPGVVYSSATRTKQWLAPMLMAEVRPFTRLIEHELRQLLAEHDPLASDR